MTRVLIVSDFDADFESREIAQQIVAAGDARISAVHVTLPPAGPMPQAIRNLARLDRQHSFDVVHAIGPSSLLAVLLIGCQPIVYSPPADDPPYRLKRLRLVSLARRVTVACGSEAARAELVARGVPRESTRVVSIAPVIGPINPPTRQDIGFEPHHKILLAVGESTHRANHYLAAWVAVILFYFDRDYRLVVWGRGPLTDGMKRYTYALRQPGFCLYAEDAAGRELSWAEVASIADVAMFAATAPVGLHATRVCQQLGLPVIAAPSPAARELDRANLQITESPRARVMAQAVHKLTESGQLTRNPHGGVQSAEIWQWVELYEDVVVGRAERAVGELITV